MDFGLDFIKKLKPCKWRYKPPLDDGLEHFGFIAQDIIKLASMDKYNFVGLNPDNDYYYLNLMEFIGPLVKASQEMCEKIDELEKQIEHLKQSINNQQSVQKINGLKLNGGN